MTEYFEKWFKAKNQAILPLSVEQARDRHERGAPYVASLQVDGKRRVVDIAGPWVSVMFFDEHDRIFLRYDFKKDESGRLFLSSAVHLEYEGEERQHVQSVTFAFKQDGTILIETRNVPFGEVQERESSADPAVNWEDYPEFGEYSSVCRLNRQ